MDKKLNTNYSQCLDIEQHESRRLVNSNPKASINVETDGSYTKGLGSGTHRCTL